MRSPGDRSTQPQHPALDEFTHENRAGAAVKMEAAGSNLFVFQCEAEPAAPIANGDLFEVAREAPVLPAKPLSPSRGESQARRRARTRRARVARLAMIAAAWQARASRLAAILRSEAHRGSGVLQRALALVTQRSSSAAAASRHAMRRTSVRLRAPMRPAPSPATVTTFEYQESNGLVVAVLLGMAVVGYGSFLVGSWRTAGVAMRPAAIPTSAVVERPVAVALLPVAAKAVTAARPAMNNPLAGTPRAPVARPVSFTPNARTLTAMWQRRDTRSLHQAFSSLRQQTLAFHRCGMRVIDATRAVARCNGVATAGPQASRAATWTIDFRRTAGRWVIARVAMG